MARSRFSLSLELQKEAAALGIWSSAGSIAIPVKGASIVVGHGTVVTSEEEQLLNCTRQTHARIRSLARSSRRESCPAASRSGSWVFEDCAFAD
jgi:hypothetical protein